MALFELPLMFYCIKSAVEVQHPFGCKLYLHNLCRYSLPEYQNFHKQRPEQRALPHVLKILPEGSAKSKYAEALKETDSVPAAK